MKTSPQLPSQLAVPRQRSRRNVRQLFALGANWLFHQRWERRLMRELPLLRYAALAALLLATWQWSSSRAYQSDYDGVPMNTAEANFLGDWTQTTKTPFTTIKTPTTRTELALAALQKYRRVAPQESLRFGIDSAALLGAAMWEAESSGRYEEDQDNAFPLGLGGRPRLEQNSFREMTLAVLYHLGEQKALNQEDWILAIAAQYPNSRGAAAAIHHRIERYLL